MLRGPQGSLGARALLAIRFPSLQGKSPLKPAEPSGVSDQPKLRPLITHSQLLPCAPLPLPLFLLHPGDPPHPSPSHPWISTVPPKKSYTHIPPYLSLGLCNPKFELCKKTRERGKNQGG